MKKTSIFVAYFFVLVKMIDILLKNKTLLQFSNVEEIQIPAEDFHLMQVIDATPEDIKQIENQYKIDASIIKCFEDIEISSHFLVSPSQVAFHISLPFYNEKNELEERPLFFILTSDKLFLFLNSDIDAYINRNYVRKISQLQLLENHSDIFDLQIEFISDYYADITENEVKRVKQLATNILQKEKFTNATLNLIAQHSFNNMLIKEMLIETERVFLLYKKNAWQTNIHIEKAIDREISDLSVVSDYLQFNAERLTSLKENVARKIDIEQNHIFKILTIITLCISLPTMIAGIYGMNFEHMPELSNPYAYPIVLGVMLLSMILPFIFFKIKRWF